MLLKYDWLVLPLCAEKDALSEALLGFGASSVSIDQDDVHQSTDDVDCCYFFTV